MNPSYDRWHAIDNSTWPYRCFVKYYDEINRMIMSFKCSFKFTYSNLKNKGARWDSPANLFLDTGERGNKRITIKQWSESFNDFDNWCRLNAVMSLVSSFETYIESVIWLAIESDPGILIQSPHSTDGIALFKHSKPLKRDLIAKTVEGCTKGTWQSRINNMEILFGSIPQIFHDNIADLEKIRNLRNTIGHAFGRDLIKSRDYSKASTEPIAQISFDRFRTIQSLTRRLCRNFDIQLNNNHIGLFSLLFFYHKARNELIRYPVAVDRFVHFKTLLGRPTGGNHTYSKDMCKWIVDYYEAIP